MDQRIPQDFNIGGWRETGDLRFRRVLWWHVLEELWESHDGTKKWRRCDMPYVFKREAR